MNTDTEYLKIIAEEIALNAEHKIQTTGKANHHLLVESGRLEKAVIHNLNSIENFTQRDTFHFNTLSKLVNICDILYDGPGFVSPDVMVLLDLMTAIRQVVPSEIRPNLKLPKAFVEIQKEPVHNSWSHHRALMERHAVDNKLIAIAAVPFSRFIDAKQKLYWGDFTWLKGYQAKLDIVDWENADCSSPTEALMSLLIGRDFNDDRFYIFCKKYIEDRTKAVTGKRQRLLEYAECEKLVLQDTQLGTASFDNRANSVSTRLVKWIKEEIDFVETLEREQPFSKLHFNMYVNRIAFFFKLLSEQKVFGDTSFKELAQQIASTCLSADGEEILAATIISKAYPKDQKMLEEMENMLVKMLEYVRSFMRKK
jgi:hypothetical protein